MEQGKRIIVELVIRQQEKVLEKCLKEKKDLEFALVDKNLQIELQKDVLAKMRAKIAKGGKNENSKT